MRSLKEMVNNNQRVTFQYYRDGDLWYTTECGFKFPVPVSDIGNATFNASDKAILFMRYIRKFMDVLPRERSEPVSKSPVWTPKGQESDGACNGRISSNDPNLTSIRKAKYLKKNVNAETSAYYECMDKVVKEVSTYSESKKQGVVEG